MLKKHSKRVKISIAKTLKEIKTFLEPILAIIGIIVLWEILTIALHIPVYVLPAPTRILNALLSYSAIWTDFFITFYAVLVGFSLGSLLGIVLAILMVHSKHLEAVLYPSIILSRNFPMVALAALFIVWFGTGATPKIIVAFLHPFFCILVNMIAGLSILEPELLDLMHSLKATRWHILVKIRLPKSLPYMFSAFKIAAPLAVTGAVVGEWMAGGGGLGYLSRLAGNTMRTSLMFAAITLLSVISLGIFIVVATVERRLLSWVKK